MNALRLIVGLALYAVLGTGCTTVTEPDYSDVFASAPASILILPPLNNSVDVEASYTFLAAASRPFAEKGYYVFPVSVIDNFMKENGLPTPGEMQAVPIGKLREHIGADTVLYVTINNWGQKFHIISSDTVVSASMRLVDARTGDQLWQGNAYAQSSSSSGSGSILESIVNAVIDQVSDTLSDATYPLAKSAVHASVNKSKGGLPKGPYRYRLEHMQ